jgi:hypothetical protein
MPAAMPKRLLPGSLSARRCRRGASAKWLGVVAAPDAKVAIEVVAKEFRTDARRLLGCGNGDP